ncbi:MAG: glycosyltransferase [Clostridia bacterium]
MKKISILVLHLNYGGLERQITTLANNLCNRYEVEIVSLYDILNGKSFYNLDKKVNVRFLLNYGPNKKEIKEAFRNINPFALIKELIKGLKILIKKELLIKKEIENIDTDILISSRIEFSKYIKRKDILTISQEHSFINSKAYSKKVKKSFRSVDYLVVMTNKAKDIYTKWLENENNKPEVVVIPNMIENLEKNKYSKLNNKQIISVGRIENIKDFPTLIDVFEKVSLKLPNIILKIVGDGSKKKSVEKYIKFKKMENKVFLLGKLDQTQVENELINSDIFILTSKYESFSLVLCEAMSKGLPCISFDVDVGPREIITDKVDGFIIENRNIDLMSDKIINILEDENLRNTMSKNAKCNSTRFYCENIVSLWEKLFFNLKK